MPSAIKFDANAAPPQWTNGSDQTIEKGTQVRLKIKGLRGEISQIFAIATIKEVRPLPNFIHCALSNWHIGLPRVCILAKIATDKNADSCHLVPYLQSEDLLSRYVRR